MYILQHMDTKLYAVAEPYESYFIRLKIKHENL